MKGFLQRRSYKLILKQFKNISDLIQTLYLGRKVRRVMKLKKIDSLKHEVMELMKMEGDLNKNKNMT